jgi:hypothetical protein
MLKNTVMAAVAVLLAAIALSAQPSKAPAHENQPGKNRYFAVVYANGPNERSDGETDQTESSSDAPKWYPPFEHPDGMLVIVGLITCVIIGWQSWQTRRAAAATEGAVKAAETSYRLARDTSERELRAYLTVSNARLFLYEDGFIEPRLTISNSGQTPAYEFKGIQALSLDRPLVSPSRPSDDILLRYGTVGRDYWLTGEMRKVGTTKQQVIDYLLSGDMHVILYGWYKYQDVFGHTHPLDFQLVVSQRGTLSREALRR